MRPGLVWPWVASGVMWLWWAGPRARMRSKTRSICLDLLQAPFAVALLEDQSGLDAVGESSEDQDLALALAILLAVEDIVDHIVGHGGQEGTPLLGWYRRLHVARLLAVGVRTRVGQRVADHSRAVGRKELLQEVEEGGIDIVLEADLIDALHAPLAVSMSEGILVHQSLAQIDLLHDHAVE